MRYATRPAGLDGTVAHLFARASAEGVTDLDAVNGWGVLPRASRPASDLLAQWRVENQAWRREIRARGRDGSTDSLVGPYPSWQQAFYLAQEYATHADDLNCPVDAGETAGPARVAVSVHPLCAGGVRATSLGDPRRLKPRLRPWRRGVAQRRGAGRGRCGAAARRPSDPRRAPRRAGLPCLTWRLRALGLRHRQELITGQFHAVYLARMDLPALDQLGVGVAPDHEAAVALDDLRHDVRLPDVATVSCDARRTRLVKGWWACVSAVRIYLTSEVRVEYGDVLIGERDLPGRQGRVLLAMLVAERTRPVSRDEIAEELWGEEPPAVWDKAITVLISKLRAALRRAGLGEDAVAASFGCYRLRLSSDVWVDLEAAADGVHRAESAIADGDPLGGYPWATIAYFVGRRPFLLGEDGPWVRRKRIQLRDLQLRGLDCAVVCCAANGELAEAVQAAEDALAIEPFRESTYRHLMRALAAAGRRAEALRVYERCRGALDEHLGVPPSAETVAVHTEIVTA